MEGYIPFNIPSQSTGTLGVHSSPRRKKDAELEHKEVTVNNTDYSWFLEKSAPLA